MNPNMEKYQIPNGLFPEAETLHPPCDSISVDFGLFEPVCPTDSVRGWNMA